MTKNRHTFAKRYRELEKKQKADEKRERRTKRKQETDDAPEQSDSRFLLSREEMTVLDVFRKHLMTPGKMLCLGGSDVESLSVPLAKLINKGLLLEERFQGGYSLTDEGFAAMKNRD